MDDHNHAHGIASIHVQGRNIFGLWARAAEPQDT